MDRLRAYLGPTLRLGALLDAGSPSLVDLSGEHGDGFGLGWYPEDGRGEPARLLDPGALRTAPHHLALAERLESGAAIAALRQVDRGQTRSIEGCQPFAHGRALFAHAGALRPGEVFERPLRELLGPASYRLSGSSESALLFATWAEALRGEGPDAMAAALEAMVSRVESVCRAHRASASLAVVVGDGASLVALRTAIDAEPPRLVTAVAGEGAPVPAGGRVVSTEPFFDASWTELEPHSLTIFTVERR